MQSNQSSVRERNKSFKTKVTVRTRTAKVSGISIHETYQTISNHIKAKQNNNKKMNLTKST